MPSARFRKCFPLALVVGMIGLAGCSQSADSPRLPTHGDPLATPVATTPTDHPDGFGSEPSLLVASDGAWYFTSVLGSATARGDGLWRSTDEGATWGYLGKADYPFGGGDSDIDELPGGRLLLTGQWRPAAPPAAPIVGSPYVTGGESVSYSDDGGRTWVPSPAAGYVPAADRNWLAVQSSTTAYLAFNDAATGLMVAKTVDGGVSWLPPVVVAGTGSVAGTAGGPTGIAGDAAVGPDGTVYIPYSPGPGAGTGGTQQVISTRDGVDFVTHTVHVTPAGESAGAVFSSIAVDDAGTLYLAWSETRGGGMRALLSHSTDQAVTWSPPVQVVRDDTVAVFPWVTAGAAGNVAVSYYATSGSFRSDEAPEQAQWLPTASILADALGHPDAWTSVAISLEPNHVGPLCTGGTGCDPAYRQLGDFFESALTADGRLVTVWCDDNPAHGERTNRVAVLEAPRLR